MTFLYPWWKSKKMLIKKLKKKFVFVGAKPEKNEKEIKENVYDKEMCTTTRSILFCF